MKKTMQAILALLLAISSAGILLTGCATTRSESPALYDLGPLNAAQAKTANLGSPALPALTVGDVHAPSWLENPLMYFRLDYANELRPQPYAGSRWLAPPAQLLSERIKARLAQAGGVVLSLSDGAANVPVLRIDADEFIQHFTAPGQSMARIAIRASVFNGRTWVAQKSFVRQIPAPTADAAGGVKALSEAADAAIQDMTAWLASLPLAQ